jgi:hypothetical protein
VTGPLRIGDLIHGYAEGAFGRDFYKCARVEAIATDWVVVRDLDGTPWFAGAEGDRGFMKRIETARRDGDYPHSIQCPMYDDLED